MKQTRPITELPKSCLTLSSLGGKTVVHLPFQKVLSYKLFANSKNSTWCLLFLTLSIIRYGSMVSGVIQGNELLEPRGHPRQRSANLLTYYIYIYIYTYIYTQPFRPSFMRHKVRLVGWVLWHINLCRLFNA